MLLFSLAGLLHWLNTVLRCQLIQLEHQYYSAAELKTMQGGDNTLCFVLFGVVFR